MSNFKKATQMKLRFQTEQGFVSVERLWDLDGVTIAKLANEAQKTVDALGGATQTYTWDDSKTTESKELELAILRKDILADILETKKADKNAAANNAMLSAKEQKLMARIAAKEDEALDNMSLEDLKKQLAEVRSQKK